MTPRDRCDIFDTTAAELLVTTAENLAPRRAAAAGSVNDTNAGNSGTVRPLRAILRPDP
ncbi:hypothetical protein [Micromonospora sp. KLBMP9576]|uniref:hypothetical protein n=1 Tax=Micromonospora sp. KLBMP9576 TaxID=3424769 RepID=UPI003D8C4A47